MAPKYSKNDPAPLLFKSILDHFHDTYVLLGRLLGRVQPETEPESEDDIFVRLPSAMVDGDTLTVDRKELSALLARLAALEKLEEGVRARVQEMVGMGFSEFLPRQS